MRPRILLLSGTSEGATIARGLLEAGLDVVATVTREEAREGLFGPLMRDVPTVELGRGEGRATLAVEVRRFDVPGLCADLRGGFAAVLDASHPFAARITRIARDACDELKISYVRYDRPDLTPPDGTRLVSTFDEAAELLPSMGHRIMLTVGSKPLGHFARLHDRLTLLARILPAQDSLAQAFDAGFAADRVFCLRPPFSAAFNRAFFAEYRAEVLVAKASGVAGGVVEKVEAARDLGMGVLMIRRPPDGDAPTVSTVAEAVAACVAAVTGPG